MKKMMKKQGFTLIELMVVVIIVGILAAVAVPLMSANKDKAIASEAIAALGSVDTAGRLYFVENSSAPANVAAIETAGLIKAGEMNGTYWSHANITTLADGIGFGSQGSLSNGTATAKGMTFSKAAGKYTTSGSYTTP